MNAPMTSGAIMARSGKRAFSSCWGAAGRVTLTSGVRGTTRGERIWPTSVVSVTPGISEAPTRRVIRSVESPRKVARKQLELDFVCNLGSSRYYIQSAYSLSDEAKRSQEIRPFRKIDDSFKKIVITKDIVQPHYDEYGILTINIYDPQ